MRPTAGRTRTYCSPITYARALTGRTRTARANQHLGVALAFVAGATNAGELLAAQQYTSHMTGIVSEMADNIALGRYGMVLTGLGRVTSFVLGAACCSSNSTSIKDEWRVELPVMLALRS
ncbi:MAG: DUF1275 domain-containing protein [Burkholderiaceae bacterium]|nr:DUF1275 domain-containing protein [Burkholderiaceae bacterium]